MSTEQQPKSPTEAEIAAARDAIIFIEAKRFRSARTAEVAHLISRHNAPLHAKLEKQKAALELAQKALNATYRWDHEGDCVFCANPSNAHDSKFCEGDIALAATKEAL